MRALTCRRILILSMLIFPYSLLCHGKPVNNDTSRIENKLANDREYDGPQLRLSSDKELICMIDRRRLLNELDYQEELDDRQLNLEIDSSPEFSHSSNASVNYAQSPSYKEDVQQPVTSNENFLKANYSSLYPDVELTYQQRDVNEKRNTLTSIDEASLAQLEENNVHARVKRNVHSSLNSKKAYSKKRSPKSSSKAHASSNTPKDDSDNDEPDEISEDLEKDDYVIEDDAKENEDETERQSSAQDVDSFVEQDERSNLYDDFEAKDVAKRGVENAGDYEEFQDDLPAPLDDAELDQERVDVMEEVVKGHDDVRVKREGEKMSEGEVKEIASKEKRQSRNEDSKGEFSGTMKDDSQAAVQQDDLQSSSLRGQESKIVEGNAREAKVDEGKLVLSSGQNARSSDELEEANNNLITVGVSGEGAKAYLASNEKDGVSVASAKSNDAKQDESRIEYENSAIANGSNKNAEEVKDKAEQGSPLISTLQAAAPAMINDQTKENNQEVKNQRTARVERGVTNEQKAMQLNEQQKPVALSSTLDDLSKIDSKVSASEVSDQLTPGEKCELSNNIGKNTNVKIIGKQTPTSSSSSSDASRSESGLAAESDAEYQKTVEEEIQRKIDSIKEDIKRDIEENQRIREIEANNARFDELQSWEDVEDQQSFSSARDIEENRSVSKRSAGETGKSTKKREVKRRRQYGQNKVERRSNEMENVERLDPAVHQRSCPEHEGIRKRSATKLDHAEQTAGMKKLPMKKKRDYARQAFLVNDGREKIRKRRRSAGAILIPEQAHVKVEDELPADFVLGAELRGPVVNLKNSLSSPMTSEKGLSEMEQSFSAEGKSDTLASLTGSSQELSPRLATEYKEAFGGLQDKPDGALARFKRIKRVLRKSS